LFGDVRSLGATADRIYVLERRLALVRVYDRSGAHLFDIGGKGQGPGEFNGPWGIAIDPAGRLLVQETARVTWFELDGTLIETWTRRAAGPPATITADGTAFIPTYWDEGGRRISGAVAVAPDSSEGRRVSAPPFDLVPWQLRATQGDSAVGTGVPHAPGAHFTVLPSAAIVRGISDSYRFEIEHADGTHTAVERHAEIPSVPRDEREWLTDYWTTDMRSVQPDWQWHANPVPEQRPAFEGFFGDRAGRIWVHRIIGSEAIADCDPNAPVPAGVGPSCWRDLHGFDIFEEASGRFLGQVSIPAGARISSFSWPAFLEDGPLLVVEDQAGTIKVKRYRLVLPGEE
jgi:hypothetical protein